MLLIIGLFLFERCCLIQCYQLCMYKDYPRSLVGFALFYLWLSVWYFVDHIFSFCPFSFCHCMVCRSSI